MKKNSLLSLLLVAVLASGASAAQSEAQAEAVILPTYVVDAQRYSAAEQRINDSLAELRAQAGTPVTVSVELPALKAQVAHAAKVFAATRVAKS